MRIFWLIILVLAVLTVFVVWRGGERDAPAMVAVNADRAPTINASRPETSNLAKPQAATSRPGVSDADIAALLTPAGSSSESHTNSESDAQALVDDLLDSSDSTTEEDVGKALSEGTPAPIDQSNVGKVDGKYILAGDGSAEHPFEITWDLLVLASQTYQPRLNRTEIPPQVSAANGKRIKITGYFAFPLASMDAREVLFMLNMWDGCCIGVPPSPYDAIEVRLKEPMPNARKQFTNYGTLTGTLKVDPYVQDGWLLGMYLMEDGAIEPAM